MIDRRTVAVLNRAFVRLHRSLTQYLLREAWPELDVGESELRAIAERQSKDVERLGRFIVEEAGSVYPGNYPTEYGDLHYLNASYVLSDWIASQEKLIKELDADVRELAGPFDAGSALLREILAHERENLGTLRRIAASLDAHASAK